jgi:hypothetical protein
MADEKIDKYFWVMWEMYKTAKKNTFGKSAIDKFQWGYQHGYLQGVDDALETFKSMFDLAEYAEGSE